MRYTVQPGRWIYRDGEPFVSVGCAHTSRATGAAPVNPAEADEVARKLARWLNRDDTAARMKTR